MKNLLALLLFILSTSIASASDPAKENYATIYVLRPTVSGSLLRSSIDLNDQYLGSTYGMTYIKTRVPAGKHVITGEMQNRSNLTLNVEPGKTYFVKQRILPGILVPNTRLVKIDSVKALKLLGRCRPSQEQSLRTDYVQY